MKILNRWTNACLWDGDKDNLRDELIAAVDSGADLSGANLSHANLSHADLSGANLSHADLYGANLYGADLSHANLSGANLSHADLYGANLYGADLSGADLSHANLSGANLSHADLYGANLYGADLSGADLSGVKGANPLRTSPLHLLTEQVGKIRLYKLVNAEGVGPFNGGIKYELRKSYEVLNANTDPNEECAAGINVATLDWCLRKYQDGYRVLVVEFTAKDIACIPHNTDGKLRLFRCKVVGEKTLDQLGITAERKAAEEYAAQKAAEAKTAEVAP